MNAYLSDPADTTAAARKSLQDRGVQLIVIADSNICSIIARVNKGFLAANYVLADGAVLVTVDALNVARAAKRLAKPAVALAGYHPLCPVKCCCSEALIELGPLVTAAYHDGQLLDRADFPNPLADYIEPQFVDVFMANK